MKCKRLRSECIYYGECKGCVISEAYKHGFHDSLKVMVDEPDRPHGEWIECEDKRYCECSNCWVLVTKKEAEDFGDCPNCGAKMKEGDEK